jgi:hypothetical protein
VESFYKTVVDSKGFNLDKDAFDGCDNDLLVSVTSQLGGLEANSPSKQQSYS